MKMIENHKVAALLQRVRENKASVADRAWLANVIDQAEGSRGFPVSALTQACPETDSIEGAVSVVKAPRDGAGATEETGADRPAAPLSLVDGDGRGELVDQPDAPAATDETGDAPAQADASDAPPSPAPASP